MFGDFKVVGYSIYGNCCGYGCGWGRWFNLDKLIEWFGVNYVVIREIRILVLLCCEGCEYKGGSLMLYLFI